MHIPRLFRVKAENYNSAMSLVENILDEAVENCTIDYYTIMGYIGPKNEIVPVDPVYQQMEASKLTNLFNLEKYKKGLINNLGRYSKVYTDLMEVINALPKSLTTAERTSEINVRISRAGYLMQDLSACLTDDEEIDLEKGEYNQWDYSDMGLSELGDDGPNRYFIFVDVHI